MQGSYSKKIGKVFSRISVANTVFIAVVMLIFSAILSTNQCKLKLEYHALEYARLIDAKMALWDQTVTSIVDAADSGVITDADSVLTYVTTVAESNESFSAAYIAYEDKTIIMSGGWDAPDDFDPTQRDWYTGAASQDATYVTEPYTDEQTGQICITMSRRILDDSGNLTGIAAIDFYLDDIVNIVETDSMSTYAFIVTGEGTILTHPYEELKLSESGSSNVSDAYNGKYSKLIGTNMDSKVLFEFKNGGIKNMLATTVGSEGWYIYYVEPVFSSFTLFLIILLLSIVISFGAIKYVESFCNRELDHWFAPLISIAEKAIQISEGNLDVVFDEEPIAEEVAMLTVSMNETVEKLKVIINDISNVVNRISANDLSVGVEADYQGTFVAIKNSLETILDKLNGAFGMVNEQSEIVVNYSGQVQESTLQVASGATEQSMAVSGLADNIKVLAEQSDLITKNAEKAKSVSELTNSQLAEGNEQMKELLAAMDTIEETSRQIGAIITTINDISEQTNLLSLNASIEAARAGDAGRGFAVVADEISKLAAASASSSDTIAQLIQNSNKAVEQGKTLADRTSATLQTGISNSLKSKDDIMEITQFVHNQADAIVNIENRLNDIVSIIDANAAASQENAAISDELINCAHALKETVDEYHLRGQATEDDMDYEAQDAEGMDEDPDAFM